MSIYDQRPWLARYDTGLYMGASYGPPTVPAAIVNNLEQFYASVEKLRGIATETNATLVFGHDADQIHQLRTTPDGSYR